MKTFCVGILFTFIFAGCAPYTGGYRTYFDSKVPITPKPLKDRKCFVFSYNYHDGDIHTQVKEMKKLLADDYEIIGEASFKGDYQNPFEARKMLKSKGSNLLLVGIKKVGKRDVVHSRSVGATVDWGHILTGQPSGTSTSSGASKSWTESIGQYEQFGLFLRSKSTKKDLWELSIDDLQDQLDLGSVKYIENDNLTLAVYKKKASKEKLVFFYNTKKNRSRKHGDSVLMLPTQKGQKIKRGDLVATITGDSWTSYLKMPVTAKIEYTERGFMKVFYTGYDTFYSNVTSEGMKSIYPLIDTQIQ